MSDNQQSDYLFVVCQSGAEAALKAEIGQQWPDLRFAYSRPGFVTFRLPPEHVFASGLMDLKSTFARTQGISLGQVQGDSVARLTAGVWDLVGGRSFSHLHAWQRDRALPGENGIEPGPTPLAEEAAAEIMTTGGDRSKGLQVNQPAHAGQIVLDCVLVEPSEWWIGFHEASTPPTRWPGGVYAPVKRKNVVSRAYHKFQEALYWSELPFEIGDACAEIGSAPGGAAQAMLDLGLKVTGIDPADVDETISAHPNFTHIRKRVADMKRREFSSVRWLLADTNVAPTHTLDSVEAIVIHQAVHIRGLILTLKLPDWKLAAEIPTYLQRIRGWGYRDVRARQLAFNRREFCVAAMRSRSQRRMRV